MNEKQVLGIFSFGLSILGLFYLTPIVGMLAIVTGVIYFKYTVFAKLGVIFGIGEVTIYLLLLYEVL
jgi:hypothetical protein